jgi:hypothetical protein
MQPPKFPHMRLELALLARRRRGIGLDVLQRLRLVIPILAVGVVEVRHLERLTSPWM